jgi:hypothetical protein
MSHFPNFFNQLPPKGSIISEYEYLFYNIHTSNEFALLLMYLSKHYCYKSKINSFVWGSVCKKINGVFEPNLQKIINEYNQAPLKPLDNICGYFVFQYCGKKSGWNAYYTTTPSNEGLKQCKTTKVYEFIYEGVYRRLNYTPFPDDMESIIVENISEKDIYNLAIQFYENGVCDVNHML